MQEMGQEDPLEKEMALVFLPGKFHSRGTWRAIVHWAAESQKGVSNQVKPN